ncbi:serine--tRNA ligase, mitochondrial [Halyomorpha halys]|uniref:serine--tRNA ligase, mitochondrial n=1 Tax=Halyomorpha halys TaxID=286706 RepID=UPI0006D51D4E|nr:serine--tRNA ligase, mitochondrial [Halyomorpha halys]
MFKEVTSNIFNKYACRLCFKYKYSSLSSNITEHGCRPDLNFSFLCDPANHDKIMNNIKRRKGIGDINKVLKLHKDWLNSSSDNKDFLKSELIKAALKIPNMSHSEISHLNEEPVIVREIGRLKEASFKFLTFEEIANKFNLCRTDVSKFTGPRSYYLLDQLALLEQALIKYALFKLKKLNFSLLSVPDILPRNIIEMCGMETRGKRNQVYTLDQSKWKDLCLSGTAEMGIAYYLSNIKLVDKKFPLKIAAVSRCFRAETSKISEEKGIYRVHQFTKVEMFGVSPSSQSDSLLNEFVQIQEDLFNSLGLVLRTLDMPPHELGAQAARKFDIEGWLPGKKKWGELSSASNCTDYQSRRLGITSGDSYLHTINGTACAIPRLIIALLETYQEEDGRVILPEVLEPFLGFRNISNCSFPKPSVFKVHQRFS